MRQLITLFILHISLQVTSQSLNLPSAHLEELTWTEVREALDNGFGTIIIATGGTEQNGPHMALGKHNVRIKYVAEKIAYELGDALVAPVVAYVPEGGIEPVRGHMRFPGTIHLPEEYFKKLLEYASRSFKQHGFTDIVLIGDSGGNQKGMKEVSEQLNNEWRNTDTRVHFVSDFYRGWGLIDDLISEGIPEEAIGKHAGLIDVSYMLAVDSDMVRLDVISDFEDNPEKNSKLGFSGDPSMASAEIGKKRIEQMISVSVDQIAKLKKENRE